MKIAIIGNSHAVALRDSVLDGNVEVECDLDVDFYAAPARDAHRIEVIDKNIVPLTERAKKFYISTSGGNSIVNVSNYDVVWLYGLTEQLDKIGAWYQTVYSSEFFSKQVKNKSFIDRYNVGLSLARNVSGLCNNVFISPRPMPSDAELIDKSCDYRINSMQPVIDYMTTRTKSVGASFLTQPRESLFDNENYLTDPEYSKGSNNLSVNPAGVDEKKGGNSVRQDYLHMNGKFGALMWDSFLSMLPNSRGET